METIMPLLLNSLIIIVIILIISGKISKRNNARKMEIELLKKKVDKIEAEIEKITNELKSK